MVKRNIPYLAFDDRKLLLLGIPILSFLVPFLFFGLDFKTYISYAHQEYFESLTFTTVFWLSNRYLIIQLRKKYSALNEMLIRIAWHVLIVILSTPLINIIVSFLMKIFYTQIKTTDLFEPTLTQATLVTYFLIFSVTGFYDAIYFFHKYKEAILEKERIQKAHIQAQLDNLRNQINPHFLFNSLNTLMNLIPMNSKKAMNYLSKLSKFYRYTVSNREKPLVTLQTELDNVKIYTDLLKERFHNGIDIDLLEMNNTNKLIVPLCLQLLIENAVKHNIVSKKKPLFITIKMVEEGTYIEVKNNIQKKIQKVNSTGMGLDNIRNRIAFFTNNPLRIEDKHDFFTVAVPLVIPQKKEE